MDLTRRVARRLLESDVPLRREPVAAAAKGLIRAERGGPPINARNVVDEVLGLGPLEDLLRDGAVSDVLVNGDGNVWVERDGALSAAGVHMSAVDLRAAIERVVAPLGLRIDRSSPSVDARLPDGSRLHAAIPPISVDGPILAIRRFTAAVSDIDSLIASGGASEEAAALLREQVESRANVLVGGGTGAGKTTLLNVLLAAIPPSERVVTVEDAVELRPSGHAVRLEARPANSEGAGEIDLSVLVRNALRLRPDRLIVGEVRGPEAFDMVQAMSTGHAGSMSTVHAGSAAEALWRVETLARSSKRAVASDAVRRQLMASLDVVVQMERHEHGRRVASISVLSDGALEEAYRCS